MWQQQLLVYAPMFLLITLAAITDVRSRRIPNWASAVLVLSGLVEAFCFDRGPTPIQALQGMLLGFALPFILFAINALGAGDVKLLAGLGAWLGPGPLLNLMLVSVLLAGVLVVVQSLFTGRLLALLRNCYYIVVHFMHVRRLGMAYVMATGQTTRTLDNTLPYAVPICAAAVLTVFWPTLVGRLL
jgi:prepilin peptidase CpaA